MDIIIKKKPWYIRHKYYIAGGMVFIACLIYVIILSAGPRKLRVDTDSLQI
ncbi:hypothetical protein EZS27_037359, partial [termite gut metagenome]